MRNIVFIVLCAASMLASAQVVSLDSCRHMALRNNKEIQQATMAIDKAGYQRKEAAAAYLPQFDLTAGYIYNSRKVSLVKEDQMLPTKSFNPQTGQYDYNLLIDPSTGYPVQVNGQYVPTTVALLPKSGLTYNIHNLMGGALTVTQPIYMGGKITAMNQITDLAQQLAREMRESKVEDVIYNVEPPTGRSCRCVPSRSSPAATSTWSRRWTRMSRPWSRRVSLPEPTSLLSM